MTALPASFLATRRSRLTLLLCAVGSTAPCWPAIFLLAAAVIAPRATNTHGEPALPSGIHAVPGQVPAPELAD